MIEFINKGNRMRKILAVFIAFLIWFYVGSIENPIAIKSLQVPIELVNLSQHYQGIPYDSQISLVVEGRSKKLQSLTAADIKAELNLSNVHIGDNYLDVIIKTPNGIKVIRKQPNQILVNVRRLNEKVVPVTYNYHGQLKAGIKLDGVPTLSIDQVKIFGSNELLSSIDSAAIDIDLDNLKDSIVIKRPLVFYDSAGNIISNRDLKSSVNEVEASIKVVSEKKKRVPVKIALNGEMPKGYNIDDLSYEHKEVYIYGEASVLNNISEIFTKPISLAKIKETQTLEVDLDIPAGINVSDSQTIAVTLEVSKEGEDKNSSELLVLPIKIIGQTKSKIVTLSKEEVEVYYDEGKKPTEALVDVSDLETGNYELKLDLNGNGTIKDSMVTVTIE